MKLCAMRYGSFLWHHNPKSLQIICGKKVVTLSHPNASDIVENFGEKPVVIKGVGELFGKDCLKQFEKLKEVYKKGESAVLCIPDLSPLYMCFDSLELKATDRKDVLTYSFSFTQLTHKDAVKYRKSTFLAEKDQTLFDVAQKTSLSVEKLLSLNDDIMFVNDIKEGQVLKLC